MSALYTSSRYRTEALHQFHADEYLAKPIDFGLHDVLEKVSAQAARSISSCRRASSLHWNAG